jgi:large subunit ribosomal protein L5
VVAEQVLARLMERYRQEIVPAMMKEFDYTNVMQVPRLEKVVVNIGLGEAIQDAKALETAERDVAAISGQHPVITRAKKSIAGFKLRAGMPIGMMVTLRGRRMYEFLDRLVNAVLPRIRDFRGVPRNSFDGRGNYSLGLKDQLVFPEIDYDKVDKPRGLEVTIVTTAASDEEGRRLLELLGFPIMKG